MQIRRLLTAAATVAAVAAVPVTATAGSSADRATGGGQILIGKSAGDTITFTARQTNDGAEGRVTFIDREAGSGRPTEKFHGIVECIRVDGTYAEISGSERDSGNPFNLRVQDNGEGAAAENDFIQFDRIADPDCSEDDGDDEFDFELGRGNAQVYDASSASSSSSRKASSKSTTTTSSTSLTSSLLR